MPKTSLAEEYVAVTPTTTRLWIAGIGGVATPAVATTDWWDSSWGVGAFAIRRAPTGGVLGGGVWVMPSTSSDDLRLGADAVIGRPWRGVTLGLLAGPMVRTNPLHRTAYGASAGIWAMSGPVVGVRAILLQQPGALQNHLDVGVELTLVVALPTLTLASR
ncbi:MAG: hypothetical protein IPL79_05315 [Myxococcales bacterium]|nr:hypothetical protein [Myxococcales bacterium]